MRALASFAEFNGQQELTATLCGLTRLRVASADTPLVAAAAHELGVSEAEAEQLLAQAIATEGDTGRGGEYQ